MLEPAFAGGDCSTEREDSMGAATDLNNSAHTNVASKACSQNEFDFQAGQSSQLNLDCTQDATFNSTVNVSSPMDQSGLNDMVEPCAHSKGDSGQVKDSTTSSIINDNHSTYVEITASPSKEFELLKPDDDIHNILTVTVRTILGG